MHFLVISQRAQANPHYNLKDLPGHGRFDVVVRCILAASRPLDLDPGQTIFCYLKGSEPSGWLEINPDFLTETDDEISLAAKIQASWSTIFRSGSLTDLAVKLPRPYIYLTEDGDPVEKLEGTIILGAQNDPTEEDLEVFETIDAMISLGTRSLLASHAIIYTRQVQLRM